MKIKTYYNTVQYLLNGSGVWKHNCNTETNTGEKEEGGFNVPY